MLSPSSPSSSSYLRNKWPNWPKGEGKNWVKSTAVLKREDLREEAVGEVEAEDVVLDHLMSLLLMMMVLF